jgi:hypothetical protein
MKNFMNLFFAAILIFQLIGCDKDDVIIKTPGELTGEKIIELVTSEKVLPKCSFWQPKLQGTFSFTVEGQFLHVTSLDGYARFSLDLNKLLYYQVTDYKELYFTFIE